MTESLPKAVEADRLETNNRSGRLSYYRKGKGSPVLLLHSINAAGSVFEVKPIFDALSKEHTVFAPDLPGFGFSDRSRRDYNIALYTDAIRDMLEIINEAYPGAPIDALALSLSAEFLARVANDEASRFRSLAFVTPTGFRRGSSKMVAADGATREMKFMTGLGNIEWLRGGLYRLLVRPRIIRYFLKRTWGSDDFDESLARYDDSTTHQPGAENAPLAFLSGKLFGADIRRVYESIELPVWVPHGTKGDFGDFSETAWAEAKGNWRFQAFAGGALPHFEYPKDFINDYRVFLSQVS